MPDPILEQLRSFNRTVTRTIGALEDDYLGRERPLAQARLIFEIGTDGALVQALRERLQLDSGYLSRLLRALEGQGLVITRPEVSDRRSRVAELTTAGLEELDELNRLSDELARSIIEPLSSRQRKRLQHATGEVERLLLAASARIDEESPRHPDARQCLDLYYAELGERFEEGFDPDYGSAPQLEEFAPPRGSFLIVRLGNAAVGCGAIKPLGNDRAYLKRMWIAKSCRGLGLGQRLLDALEEKARSLGYNLVCLETNSVLTEAQQLYRKSGYREVEPFNVDPYAHRWFEKALG